MSEALQSREVQPQPVKDGKQPDGSVWLRGMCISPAPDSDEGRTLARYYDTHEFTGD